jgi:hypothetical protein
MYLISILGVDMHKFNVYRDVSDIYQWVIKDLLCRNYFLIRKLRLNLWMKKINFFVNYLDLLSFEAYQQI